MSLNTRQQLMKVDVSRKQPKPGTTNTYYKITGIGSPKGGCTTMEVVFKPKHPARFISIEMSFEDSLFSREVTTSDKR